MSDSTGRFFEGLIVGGVLGFLFGVLSAPKSGAEMRKQLADGSEDLYKQATDSIAELKDRTNQAIADLQCKGEVAIKKAADVVHTKKEQMANKLQDMANQGKAQAEDIESLSSS
jgi:gas vesicle protein